MGLEVVSGKIAAVPPGTWPDCFKVVGFASMQAFDAAKYKDALIDYALFLDSLDNPVLTYPSTKKADGKWDMLAFPPDEALRGAADVFLTRFALYEAVPEITNAEADALGNWLGGEGGEVTWNDNWFTAIGKNISPVVSIFGNMLADKYFDPDQFIKSVQPKNVQLGPTLLKLRKASPFVHYWVIQRAFGKALNKSISQKANVEQQQKKIVMAAALKVETAGTNIANAAGAIADAANDALKSAGDALGYVGWITKNLVPIAVVGGLAYFLFFTPAGAKLLGKTVAGARRTRAALR